MAAVWFLYLICMAIWFREHELNRPKRKTSRGLTLRLMFPAIVVTIVLFYAKTMQEVLLTSIPIVTM